MKTLKYVAVIIMTMSLFGFSQPVEHVDFISPFNEGVAAIKKDGQWAFVNEKGIVVIDFRSDLVLTNTPEGDFPIFRNGRCLIEDIRAGISYFGYIGTDGTVVIEPQYLNALNFEDDLALVLELIKIEVGTNENLGKDVVYDKYLEAVIDTNGTIIGYISPKRTNVILDKKFLKAPPEIKTKKMSSYLYAQYNDDDTWSLRVIN